MAEIPKELEAQVNEFYSMQTQMQFVMYQKQQFRLQLDDAELALGELGKGGEGEVYKNAGLLMIRTTREDAKKELEEKKEMVGVRLNSLSKQESSLREKMDELKKKLEAATKRKV